MIQNAEDARARIVKIVSVSKVSKPARTPGSKREKSGKKHAPRKKATMTSSSWRPPFAEVFSVSLHALTLQPAMKRTRALYIYVVISIYLQNTFLSNLD